MGATLVVHQSTGPSQSASLWPLATVYGDDLIVRLPNGDGEAALADAEATIGWGDGWRAAQANEATAGRDVIGYLLIHTIGNSEVRRYDIESGDEILVYPNQIIEFPFNSGDQMRCIVDGDHLVIQFPGELGFLTLLNFQKYLLDPETAARLEWGLGGNNIAVA